jgi:CHAD domain-containing protein
LASRLVQLRGCVADVRSEPHPEAIHQIRVSARRLYAALSVFRPLLEIPIRGRALRRIEGCFGQVRDRDVLCARLTADPSKDVIVAEAAERLSAEFAADRSELLEASRESLRDAGYRSLMRRLGAWLARPRFTGLAALPLEATAPDLLLPELSSLLLHPGWSIETIPEPDDPAGRPLHALRREIKSFRYQAECLAAWYGLRVSAWLEELHTLQDALGNWHDEGLLLAALDAAGAPAGLTAAARDRSSQALVGWIEWRTQYLDPKSRASLRGLLEPGAPGVQRAVDRAAPAGSGSSLRPGRSPTRAAPDRHPIA